MPTYTEYLIDFSKVNENTAQDLLSVRSQTEHTDISASMQAQSLSETTDILNQNKIFTDDNFAQNVSKRGSEESRLSSIYGKAQQYKNNKAEIVDSYREQSNKEAQRFTKLNLIIDGKTTSIERVAEEALEHHNSNNTPLKAKEDITMDMIVDYLQDKHKIQISVAQRNFFVLNGIK